MSRRRAFVVVVVSCIAYWGSAAAPVFGAGAPPLPDFAVGNRLMPEDPLPERETRWSHPDVTLTDVLYAERPGFRPLRLDLYRSTRDTDPKPLVVFFHGGGFAYANPRAGGGFRNFPEVLAYLAGRGYVVASVEYRFMNEAAYPAQLEDAQAAIRFLRENGARLGIDGRRVALWGMSAGAYLAGMAAMNCAGACVDGWVGWFGVYDFTTSAPEEEALRQLLGCGAQPCSLAVREAASPIHYADAHDPPALLLHGTADVLRPATSDVLVQRLQEVGAPVELVLLPGVGHGMVGPTDADTRAALRRSLEVTFAFFDRTLRQP